MKSYKLEEQKNLLFFLTATIVFMYSFIGGTPAAGKSTLSEEVAKKFNKDIQIIVITHI